MSNEANNDRFEHVSKTTGGIVLGQAVKRVADSVVPGSGFAASAAAAFLPERAKHGAAAGAVLGGSAAAHAISIGTAGAMAAGASMLLPLVLGGALVGGVAALILGGAEKKDQK